MVRATGAIPIRSVYFIEIQIEIAIEIVSDPDFDFDSDFGKSN